MKKDKSHPVTKTKIHDALSGMPYPAGKQDLIKYARARGKNGGIVPVLEKLPEMEYSSESQVLSTIKEYVDL